MNKKKNSILKIERPNLNKPGTLLMAENSKINKKAGRKPIPIDEKATEEIGFKVTLKQKEAIQKQAGLIPIATYIKAKLKECNVI